VAVARRSAPEAGNGRDQLRFQGYVGEGPTLHLACDLGGRGWGSTRCGCSGAFRQKRQWPRSWQTDIVHIKCRVLSHWAVYCVSSCYLVHVRLRRRGCSASGDPNKESCSLTSRLFFWFNGVRLQYPCDQGGVPPSFLLFEVITVESVFRSHSATSMHSLVHSPPISSCLHPIQAGDFVVKAQGVDVTRLPHSEVIRILTNTASPNGTGLDLELCRSVASSGHLRQPSQLMVHFVVVCAGEIVHLIYDTAAGWDHTPWRVMCKRMRTSYREEPLGNQSVAGQPRSSVMMARFQ
jgi:hypothetical protein